MTFLAFEKPLPSSWLLMVFNSTTFLTFLSDPDREHTP